MVLISHLKHPYLLTILHCQSISPPNNEVQVDLDTFQTLANKWQAIFNPLKSETMSLRSNNGNGQNFTFQNHVINKVDTH